MEEEELLNSTDVEACEGGKRRALCHRPRHVSPSGGPLHTGSSTVQTNELPFKGAWPRQPPAFHLRGITDQNSSSTAPLSRAAR